MEVIAVWGERAHLPVRLTDGLTKSGSEGE